MKKLSILSFTLSILLLASVTCAQTIGLSFDEAATRFVIDGRLELVPNPDLGDVPSAEVYVIVSEISELSGYEYNLSSTDLTAIVATPVIYPSIAMDLGGETGDVRVDTGVCFHQGDAEAGPDPKQIRLSKHVFSWLVLPHTDVLYCVGPAIASSASVPQYTECVDSATPLPFQIDDRYADNCLSDACIQVYFEWADVVTPINCVPVLIPGVPAESSSWGALKAAY